MRRTFALTMVTMTLMLAAAGMTGLAQDKPQIPDPGLLIPGKPGQTTARTPTPLKVQLTLTRFVGEKKMLQVSMVGEQTADAAAVTKIGRNP